MGRFARLLVFLLVVPAVGWAQGLYEHPDTGFRFPARLGQFARGSVHRYDDPALGVQITYVIPVLGKLDFYVYNYGETAIPEGIKSDLVRAAFSSADKDVVSFFEAAQYLELERIIPLGSVMRLRDQNVELLVTAYKFRPNRENAEPLVSWLLVTGLRNQFIKIRYSHRASEVERGRSELDVLLRAFLDANKD